MLAGALAVVAPAATPATFEVLRWTAPGAELAALTTQPSACPRYAGENTLQGHAGQALFNSPALLGGQAAKAGLSCASCHVNGRGNNHFLMSGVSDTPGTADVTNSFFSAARGNGRFDPVAIPDLARPGKVAREPAAGALEPFIRTLIVDEFAGQEPTPAMLAALGHYVRAVRGCDGGDWKARRSIEDQLHLVRAAIDGAVDMAARGDTKAVRALIAAGRHQLGVIAERYLAPSFRRERDQLLRSSRALAALNDLADRPDAFAVAAKTWRADFQATLAARLRRNAQRSLYNPAKLGFVAPQQDSR
ncbi:MAG: hypothetical protein H2056_09010 [Sphingopyxis sp.]|nr:hypothetical protein [Sphingopyxis sp.]